METQKDNSGRNTIFDIIVYGMMIVAVLFIIIQTFTGHFTNIGFRVALGAWILIAIAISDYIGPTYSGELKKYDSRQLIIYTFASVLDGLAFMCLYVFIIFVGQYTEITHYIFLVAAVAMFLVRFVVMRTIGKPAFAEAADEDTATADKPVAKDKAIVKDEPEDDFLGTSLDKVLVTRDADRNSDFSAKADENELQTFKSRSE